ncbi:hypothetical protein CCACVL1_27096, partial [Corchorus capsularis]
NLKKEYRYLTAGQSDEIQDSSIPNYIKQIDD